MAEPVTAPSPAAVTTADLIALRHDAASLNLRASRVRALQGQNYLSPFKGRGMEFDESRPYQPGDDIRSLDWKVTARTGKAHSKLYREERERPVIIAVDYRQSMFFATRGSFKSVIAARCAALLAWCAAHQGDRIGGIIFSEQDHWERRPQLGSEPTLHLLDQLASRGQSGLDPVAPSATPQTLRQALARLRRVARPGSLVALISDFRGMDAQCESLLAQLARHNELVLVFVHDAMERELPPAGHYRITGGQRELTLDTGNAGVRDGYTARFLARREQVETLCARYRMVFIPCATDESPLLQLQRGLVIKR